MLPRRRWLACSVLLPWFLVTALQGQPPPKPAPLPPINPGQARLDLTIAGLDGPGIAIVSSEEAGIVAAACERGSIQYWRKGVTLGVRVGERTPNVLEGHQAPTTALAWGGGPLLASAAVDGKLLFWDMVEGKTLHSVVTPSVLRALAMTADGKLVAGAGDGGVITLWETATGKPKAALTGHVDWILALAFSPDGTRLASGGYDEVIRLWDVATGKKLLEFAGKPVAQPKGPEVPANILHALAFSPDSKQLAAGGSDSQVHLFNVADGKLIRSQPGHGSSVTGLAFHPSGTVLVSSSKDRTIRLWNPVNGQAIKTLEGHTAWVQGVVFVAQFTRLASVGADQTVRLWDLTEPPKK